MACRPRYLNFAKASQEDLDQLANACSLATFGLGHEDVMDESYRKALKMDKELFSTTFVPERSPLLHVIRNNLLRGDASDRPIDMELYKLNVYGASYLKVCGPLL